MTKQEDIWNCFNCGNQQGRHDMWFDGDICEECFSKINYAIIDYNMMELTLVFNEEEFVFDLTLGDIGEFWYGFECKGKLFDVNYFKESEDTYDSVLVYNTHIDEDGEVVINTSSWYEIHVIEIRGKASNYLNYKN
jgi:hypothetical protein